MQNKAETKEFRFYVLFLVAGLMGLSLILGSTPSYGQAQKALIDLNNASEKELESIKGVGPATAKKIIEGRPYKSVDDLSKAGISAKTIEGMKPLVKVGPPAIPARTTTPAKETPAKASPPAAAAKETPAKAPPAPPPRASTPTPQKASAPAATTEKTSAKAVAPAPAKLAPGQKVNINTATKEQLEALPEIGPVKAQAIIDGRPYKTIEDVMKVKGIKEGTFGKIKESITVN
jgi:competence protein ComEA